MFGKSWGKGAIAAVYSEGNLHGLAFDPHESDGYVSWFDGDRMRVIKAKRSTTKDGLRTIVTRAVADPVAQSSTYILRPIDLELYSSEVRAKFGGPDLTSDVGVEQFYRNAIARLH